MEVLELIDKKREGKNLTKEELDYVFNGYLNGSVPDYQMSSMLMAICINGMSLEETIDLTDLMMHSGIVLDLSSVNGVVVDKHSTGGIGDKTTLVLGPILASLGLKVAKLSGRGLGYTGGTIDKLESIPGFRVSLTKEEFINNLNTVGFTLGMQTPEFTPLDKAIYDLRSVSGTVSSIPLIASSVMSKKLAVGAKYILIDLKVGNGALIKTKSEAEELAKIMMEIGVHYNKVVIPVLTDMNTPLGDAVGNALEVKEAIDTLKGKTGEFRNLTIELASVLLCNALNIDIEYAKDRVVRSIDDGSAYKKFLEFVSNQGGNIDEMKISDNIKPVVADKDGVIRSIDALKIGYLSLELGAGRKRKGDKVDTGVGVVLNKHLGDEVKSGDILCYLYQSDNNDYNEMAKDAFFICKLM